MQADNIAQMEEIFNEQNETEKAEPFYKSHATDVYHKVEFDGISRNVLADEYGVDVKSIAKAYKTGKQQYAST